MIKLTLRLIQIQFWEFIKKNKMEICSKVEIEEIIERMVRFAVLQKEKQAIL